MKFVLGIEKKSNNDNTLFTEKALFLILNICSTKSLLFINNFLKYFHIIILNRNDVQNW